MDESILVVEDDETLRGAVIYWLKREGLRVEAASDGLAAVEIAIDKEPELMILDLMIPELDGFGVLRVLGSKLTASVLVLTALDDEEHKVEAFALGASDYLTKPFGMRELVARVRALARRRMMLTINKGPDEAGSLAAGPVMLDLAGHLVWRRGQRVFLTPKEFELLACLMGTSGQVCTREELLERVWGHAFPADLRTVDVHVRWLRKKLEDDPTNPALIETVRGIGYRCTDRRKPES